MGTDEDRLNRMILFSNRTELKGLMEACKCSRSLCVFFRSLKEAAAQSEAGFTAFGTRLVGGSEWYNKIMLMLNLQRHGKAYMS